MTTQNQYWYNKIKKHFNKLRASMIKLEKEILLLKINNTRNKKQTNIQKELKQIVKNWK